MYKPRARHRYTTNPPNKPNFCQNATRRRGGKDTIIEKEIIEAQRLATLPLKSERAKQKIVVLNEQLRAVNVEIRSAKPVTRCGQQGHDSI